MNIVIFERFNDFDSNAPACILAESITGELGDINARLGEIEANNADILDTDAEGCAVVLTDGTVGEVVGAADDGSVTVRLQDENGNRITKSGFIAEVL